VIYGNAAPAWKFRRPLKASCSELLFWQSVKAKWAPKLGRTRERPETFIAAVWAGRLNETDQIRAMNSRQQQ
jgi:hypothetical protein